MVSEIALLKACFAQHPEHSAAWALCAYGSATGLAASGQDHPGKRPVLPGVRDWPSNGYAMLRKSVYSLFWEVWLRNFPGEQFVVFNTAHLSNPAALASLRGSAFLDPTPIDTTCAQTTATAPDRQPHRQPHQDPFEAPTP